MTGAAKPRTRIGKRIKDEGDKSKELYSLFRRSDTPTQIQPSFSASLSAGSNVGNVNFLPTSGGTMIGAIAFFPKLLTIATGVIDISKDTSDYTSRVIITPETGTTDDLVTITGAAYAGQLLFMQGVAGDTITLKNSGNIETIDGSDFSLADDDIIILMFDTTDNAWQQVTTGKQGGAGGVSFPITPTINDHGNVGTITEDLDLSLTTGHIHKITLTGNPTLTFSNPPSSGTQIEFEIEFVQDATGGRTVTWPATVAETVTISSTASTTTIITVRTNDGGTTYNAIPALRGSISLGSTAFATKELDNLGTTAVNADLNMNSNLLQFDNNSIGLKFENAAANGNVELKMATAGEFDITRSDNTSITANIRSQHASEADQNYSITVGSGSVTSADVVLSASTAKLKFEAGGAQRLEIDTTTATDLNLTAPSGGATASFNVTSTHAVDPDNTIDMTISSGSSGVGQVESSTAFLSLIAGGATRLAIDTSTTTAIKQTAFSINPTYTLFRDTTTIDDDIIGTINFSADDSSATEKIFGTIFVEATDVTTSTKDGTMYITPIKNNDLSNPMLTLNGETNVVDIAANRLDLDLDNDTSIRADTDDLIQIEIGGTDSLAIQAAGALNWNAPGVDHTLTAGSTSMALDLDEDADVFTIGMGSVDHFTFQDDRLIIEDTTSPILQLKRNAAGIGADGVIQFIGDDDAGTPNETVYATIQGSTLSDVDTAEDGQLDITVMSNGSPDTVLQSIGTASGLELGFFGSTSIKRVSTNTNPTAGATYTSAEQDQIQDMWDALVAYGLLDETP